MDNITHTLTGVLLSRAGLNRISPQATLLLLIAVNAPDADVLAGLSSPAAYLQYHRGPTHSLVAIPLLALLVTALVWLFRRKGFSWSGAYLVSLIGVASNPIFDCVNSYGVRLLWPFSERWIHADFIAIVDVWILALLALGLVAPWMSRLVSSEMGVKSSPSRGVAIAVLCLVGFYGFGRFLLHRRAVAVLDSRMYRGELPRRVAAMPTRANPFRWAGLVEGSTFIEMHPNLNPLGDYNPSAGFVYYKAQPGPEIGRARHTEAFRVFLGFAQWPLWSVTPAPDPEGGVMVEVTDLRFGPPGGSAFSASAVLDAGGRVIKSAVRF